MAGVFGAENALGGEVVGRRFAGRENLLRLRLDTESIEVEVATERDLALGDKVAVRIRSDAVPPAAFALERTAG